MRGRCGHNCAQWGCSSGDREVGLGWGGCQHGEAIHLLGMLGMLLSQIMLENLANKKYLLFIDAMTIYFIIQIRTLIRLKRKLLIIIPKLTWENHDMGTLFTEHLLCGR